MAIEPIPDLLAELRAGRYPHDFVQALIGAQGDDATTARRRVLEDMLSGEDGGRVLTSLLLVGGRRMLNLMARDDDRGYRMPEAIQQASARLQNPGARDLDLWTTDPSLIFRQ